MSSCPSLGDPMRMYVFEYGVESVMRCAPAWSSSSRRFRPPVWTTFFVWLPLVNVGHHAGDHRPIRVAAEEAQHDLGPPAQREVEPFDAAAVRLHHAHVRRAAAVARARLVELELDEVAPVVVDLRVLARRGAVDRAVLVTVDARPRRPRLRPELRRRRDGRDLDEIDLLVREPGELLEVAVPRGLVAVVAQLDREVLRVEPRARVVLELERPERRWSREPVA
ncbi:hypothetical protein BE20_32040 [Sorangium cellulosum]|nr:hypothetical protein BE20_32040 [Sorangium cellulosum]